jgi:hypothetical protein
VKGDCSDTLFFDERLRHKKLENFGNQDY